MTVIINFSKSLHIYRQSHRRLMNPLQVLCLTNVRSSTTSTPDESELNVKKDSAEWKVKRKQFMEAEIEWDRKVCWESLSAEEAQIVRTHKQAVLNGHFTYDQGDKKVKTRLRHFLRGTCCGNACRHVRSKLNYIVFQKMITTLCTFTVHLRAFQCSRGPEENENVQFGFLD